MEEQVFNASEAGLFYKAIVHQTYIMQMAFWLKKITRGWKGTYPHIFTWRNCSVFSTQCSWQLYGTELLHVMRIDCF